MFISNSAAETKAIGARLGENARAGDTFALCGELGAGKTQLVKGIAHGLGYLGPVTSPTFTLVHEYRGGRLPVYHLDWYRLENIEALRDVGFDEHGDGLSVIEWADKFPAAIPSGARWILLGICSADTRNIEIVNR